MKVLYIQSRLVDGEVVRDLEINCPRDPALCVLTQSFIISWGIRSRASIKTPG